MTEPLTPKIHEFESDWYITYDGEVGQCINTKDFADEYAALRARVRELEQDAKDMVPRSRYDAANRDWLNEIEVVGRTRHAAKEEIERLETQLAALTQECEAYRTGGITEELLRKGDGFLKVGTGCTVVRSDEWAALTQAHQQVTKDNESLRCVRDHQADMLNDYVAQLEKAQQAHQLAVTERDALRNLQGQPQCWKVEHMNMKAQLQQAVKERDGWQADARAAQANWHAACQDIHDLQAQLQQAVEALKERDAKIVMLYEEIGHKDSRIQAFQTAINYRKGG